VDSIDFKLPGRYPKIGSDIEVDILGKLFATGMVIKDIYDGVSDKAIYYRAAGGRYYNVVTPYPTGSSQEVAYTVKEKYAKLLGAILSTSLFWFYQQSYMDGLHIKQSELEGFPIPNVSCISNSQIAIIEEVYDKYLTDIESHTIQHETTSYTVSTFKEYKIGKSKDLIDCLDDLVGLLYGLDEKEINYIKNYELSVRLNG
jgi:hypothetical protein